MIEQLRSEIENLNQSISNWLGEIDLLNEQIDDARAEIATKEVEIERLQNDETRKAELIEVISNAGLTVEQLEAITDSIRAIDSEAIPIVNYAPSDENRVSSDIRLTNGYDSDEVTFDMLTDEMHNAMITLVGTKYQDLWRVHNRSPEIGDIITLSKRDGVSTQSTVGYTTDGISIGILPASPEKFEQLERIGANSINNRDVDLDNPILERSYKVVGVIPAAFIFLDPVYDEAENIEETVAEAVSQIDAPRHRLMHTAPTINDAWHVFNEEMPDHCRIHNIIEQDDVFIINYENHRANTTAEYYKTCEVERT
ncbi:MAG: hypothetical protein IKR04_02345 [Clostridia bacterium]|nr:hypothetical protein [Clostridia bacterium]